MRRLASGERLSELCLEYGISRKTAYKFKTRFEQNGASGLEDQSRAPRVIPHKTPPELIDLIVAERRLHPTWGAAKLKEILERRLGRTLPARSTIGNIIDRHGLVDRRTYRRSQCRLSTTLGDASGPNEIWCIDYKGQFRLGDRTYCYPLTLTDQFSRYILGCEGMAAISDDAAKEVCQEVFRAHGLPRAIRSDNGAPFASVGLAGLTRLSAYWLRLGISLERIRPAHPEENGRHERMHRTLKAETTRPPRSNILQQQECFDTFVQEFNNERPHEALAMKFPADVYSSSPRPYPPKLPELNYPVHDDVLRVSPKGLIHLPRRAQIYLSSALANQDVGIREEEDGRWLVTFTELNLGHIETSNRFTPMNPPASPTRSI
jgi:transposase InsO family protein